MVNKTTRTVYRYSLRWEPTFSAVRWCGLTLSSVCTERLILTNTVIATTAPPPSSSILFSFLFFLPRAIKQIQIKKKNNNNKNNKKKKKKYQQSHNGRDWGWRKRGAFSQSTHLKPISLNEISCALRGTWLTRSVAETSIIKHYNTILKWVSVNTKYTYIYTNIHTYYNNYCLKYKFNMDQKWQMLLNNPLLCKTAGQK